MHTSNPYAAPVTSPRTFVQVRLRDQQILRQALLFSIFYFAGFGCLIAVVSGFSAVRLFFADVVEDFATVWLPELIFALIPYVVLRASTIGRVVRPSWWSFCVAGLATFPLLNLYGNLLLTQWDTPLAFNIAAHLLSVLSAILIELSAIALFGKLLGRGRILEQDAEPELPTRVCEVEARSRQPG